MNTKREDGLIFETYTHINEGRPKSIHELSAGDTFVDTNGEQWTVRRIRPTSGADPDLIDGLSVGDEKIARAFTLSQISDVTARRVPGATTSTMDKKEDDPWTTPGSSDISTTGRIGQKIVGSLGHKGGDIITPALKRATQWGIGKLTQRPKETESPDKSSIFRRRHM